MVVGNIGLCLLGTVGLAWWVVGIVYTFDTPGSYSFGRIVPQGINADDWQRDVVRADSSLFQYSSGQVMRIYYIASFIFFGGSCFISIVVVIICTFLASFTPKDAAEDEDFEFNEDQLAESKKLMDKGKGDDESAKEPGERPSL